eukprot:s718_g9.t2
MDDQKDNHLRAGAWVKLLKIWASLRFDDVANMRLQMVWSYEGKLSGLLRRTKTTGGGKRVKELPFHVSSEAWIKEKDWVQVGLQALGKTLGGSFDLIVPAGTSRGVVMGDEIMTYQEAVAWSTEVMQELRDESGACLIPHGWERYWTEHSERATLASALAAVGVAKPDRDLLGRWTPEGSDQASKHGWLVDPEEACAAVDAWKRKLKPWESFESSLEKGSVTPEEGRLAKLWKGSVSPDSSSDSSSSESETDSAQKKRKVERLEEERPAGFIVVYNRIDRGKLHRAGREGCWMARQRKFKKAAVFEEEPDEDSYTSSCRLCWQNLGESSSSDSEDEVAE